VKKIPIISMKKGREKNTQNYHQHEERGEKKIPKSSSA
jgi:hypothetical protein